MPSATGIHDLFRTLSQVSVCEKSTGLQQMTALHKIASSKNVFEISFSRAKVRLFPSVRTEIRERFSMVIHSADR